MILVKGVFLSADRYFLILLVPALALRRRARVHPRLPAVHRARAALRGGARRRALAAPAPVLRADADCSTAGSASARCRRCGCRSWLWHGHLEWYDHALSLLDRLHFIVPPTLLLLIWLERREVYYRCAATLIAVSFAGARDVPGLPGRAALARVKHELIPHVARIGYIEGGGLAGLDVEVVDRVASPLQPGRRRAVAARRLRAARAALRLRLARAALGVFRGAVHARDVVHGRLPGRPLRRRHRRRRGLRARPAGCSSRGSCSTARCAACSGRSRRR